MQRVLDDDVKVDPELLFHFGQAITENPDAFGFVGATILPDPVNYRQQACNFASVTFFYDIALKHPSTKNLPWGVTANLLVRRDEENSIRFLTCFPKTGGGEDVVLCSFYSNY
jgi:GT2 family glycosyltransferase